MAQDDWAIVVGVSFYQGIDSPDGQDRLEGPENDAQAFRDWLLSPAGGAVPDDHVTLIRSSEFHPPFPSVSLAEPTTLRVQQAIEKLQNLGEETGRVGRRLYLYFAGHGFAPEGQPALLAANATRMRTGYHILGQYNADWFWKAGYFDEIVLFMDCCQEVYAKSALNMPYTEVTAADAVDRVKRFYGLAAKWSRLSRERKMDDGVVHGVFTKALLTGLRGAACEPNSKGEITADSLKNYLHNSMRTFLAPEDLDDLEVAKEPDFPRVEPIVLATVPPPKYPVTIHIPASAAGKLVEVLDGKDFSVAAPPVAAPPVWQLSLGRGKYLVQIPADNLRVVVVVDGTGGVDVNF